MFTTETIIHAGKTFLMLFGELFSLFIGISFVVTLLQIYISPERIKRVLTTPRKFLNSVLGALLGAVTPFCSCSTIPALVGLFKSGAPFNGAVSFLLTSPILNPAIITLMLAFFGLKATVIYTVFTFLFAVIMGLVLDKAGFEKEIKNVSAKGGHNINLTQHTLACDRQNPDIEQFVDTHHEAVLKLIEMSAENAHSHGAWIGICGELGANLELTEAFLRMGIDELSVSSNRVLPLREKIRSIKIDN